MKAVIPILILVGLAVSCTGIPVVHPIDNIVFVIGQEDKSDREFKSSGFMENPDFTCTVGIDCSSEIFPQRLKRTQVVYAADAGVDRVTIKFRLDDAYDNIVLRLARGGNETTVVLVDGEQTYLVTNEMLGSNDGYRVGVYDLSLGTLKRGPHTIQLTVADDGKGNGTYQWDALSLFVN